MHWKFFLATFWEIIAFAQAEDFSAMRKILCNCSIDDFRIDWILDIEELELKYNY